MPHPSPVATKASFPVLLATLLLALLAASAVAGTPCLTGDATLTDQRALRQLRDLTEAACPCGGFGSSGRAAYRRCASAQVDAALAGGALRRECRKTATADPKGAVCGTTRATCGRFKAGAKVPIGCKVKTMAGCRDRDRLEETPCTEQTRCSDVVTWTAGTCIDPRASGPHAAGSRIVSLTKTSVVTGEPRVLDTVVWYPTAKSGALDPATGAIAGAPLDTQGGPHPLLVFSHGGCGLPNGGRFLMPLLASHGFVVAAPPHPGSTFLDYPTCFTTAALVQSALERPADAVFVLDALLAASRDPASPLFGAVDEARVGIGGHSFGGYTAAASVAADDRFRVALLLAPAVSASLPPLGIPSLTMLGEVDSVGSVGGFDTDNAERRAAWVAAAAPKLLVEILDAGHFAFSDGCFPGLSAVDCNFPVTLSQDEAHAVVQRWVVPFLQRYLRGDANWEPFLVSPAPPGVVIERAP